MATVTNTIKLPDGSTPSHAAAVIELVASTTSKAAGWVTATDVTILSKVRPTVTNGAWTASLTPNADITPSGTVYKITETADRTQYIHYIEVDSDGGSVFDLLVDPPASLASAASEVYTTAAIATHAALTAGAHAATAITVADSASFFANATVETVAKELAQVSVAGPDAYLAAPTPAVIATSFQSGHGFTNPYGGGGTLANDSSVYMIGSQSISVTTPSGGTAGAGKTGFSLDLTARAMGVWFRIDDTAAVSQINLYAGDTALSNYKVWTWAQTSAAPLFRSDEWVYMTLDWEDATTVGSPDRANIQNLRLRVIGNTSQVAVVWFNALHAVPARSTPSYSNGVVSITFDDGWVSNYTAAKEQMAAYGYRGTAYLIPELLGSSASFMSMAQAKELRAVYGWELAAHGEDLFTGMTESELRDYTTYTRMWLRSNGLGQGTHLAYPGGQFDASVLPVIRERHASARTVVQANPLMTLPPADPFRLKGVSSISGFSGGTSIATTTGMITKAATSGAWLILVFHRIVDTPASTVDCSKTDFGTVLAALASSGVTVAPVGEVLARVS